MVARAKAKTWLGVVAGLMLPAAGLAGADGGGDVLVCQALPSRTHAALRDAIESYRRGDYETAAGLFSQAQAGWGDLSPQEQTDLTRFVQANNTALQGRREAADQLRQAEEAERGGRGQAAADLLQRALGNQYLAPAERQRAQALAERLGGRPAATPPGSPAVVAQSKLKQARELLAQGNFDAAEQLAGEAQRGGAQPGDEDPRKLLQEIARERSDPRALLATARAAFKAGNYDRAEALAHASEKAEPAWAMHLWGDSPGKVLKDVQAARAGLTRAGQRPPAPRTDPGSNMVVSRKPDGGPAVADAGGGPAPKADPARSSQDLEQARQLLQQGRKALREGQLDKARDCANRAAALKANLAWYDDNPATLLADVGRAEAARGGPARADAPATREDAKTLLQRGREAYNAGRLEEAMQLAQKAKIAPGSSWRLFDSDTPDKLAKDVKEAQTKRDQEEATRLLAQGRQLLDRGDFDGASKAALRASMLHGPYSVWDLGDRPNKLLDDVDSARKKSKKVVVPPPPAGGAVAQGGERAPQAADRGGSPVPGSGDAALTQARQLLAQARQLQAAGRLVEARARALEAQRLSSAFRPEEDRPEKALLDLAGLARKQIDACVGQADDNVRRGTTDPQAYARADGFLAQAQYLGRSFQLDTYMVDEKLAWVRRARSQGPVLAAGGTSTSSPGAAPAVNPQGVVKVHVTDQGPQTQGQTLLAKARIEIRNGNTNSARHLAEEVYRGPYGLQDEATALLRNIDAEEFEQRRRDARRTFAAGHSAFLRREYSQANVLLRSLDPKMLEPNEQAQLRELMSVPEMQTANLPAAVALQPVEGAPLPGSAPAVPGKAPAGDNSREASYLEQVQAMQEVKFQKLRMQQLDAQTEAAQSFRGGDTEAALEILQRYLSLLPESGLEVDRTNLLRRPVEARLQQYKTLKAQKDIASAQDEVARGRKDGIAKKQLAEQNKQKRIQELMAKYNTLFKEAKFGEAEGVAMQALDLDPDNALLAASVNVAKMRKRVKEYHDISNEKEEMVLYGLNDAEKEGPFLDNKHAVKFDPEHWKEIQKRDGLLKQKIGTSLKTEKEREIERRLLTPANISAHNQALGQVFDDLSNYYGVNIVPDRRVLEEAGISLDRPVDIRVDNITLKSGLKLLLDQVGLTYVIEDEVLKVTTKENAHGKLEMRAFPVAELVIPVADAGPSPIVLPGSQPRTPAPAGPTTPFTAPGSMSSGGTAVGSSSGTFASSNGGGSHWTSPTAGQTREDQLIQLITNTVNPKSWAAMGGQGTIDYFPMTMTLVINQTPDIQEQVADLLAVLRRLQDAEVAIELRLISLAEGYFERIGVNFNVNIKTDKYTQRYEPLITSGQFKPAGFINDFTPKDFVAGLTPAGTFTSDLDIPITTSSFGMAVPPFGGFPNIPGGNGGIELGLAFLSDIQVFLFMEAAQGDQRTNVMQAPKLSMFNGQTATLSANDQQYFVTSVEVINNNGQLTFVPTNTPVPTGGVNITIQSVISADRRFVRMNFGNVSLTNLASAVVPLFPVPLVITPTLEGGFTEQPVVFTQFIQQPVFNTINISTSVAVPDGGTVLLGGLKRLSEGRNEFGPPVLSKIPYINRLFKNVGYGREVQNFMMMVTPRIIINAEEEERQTGIVTAPQATTP
jgi:type II secretory pathway component GspD/PulD (secretin)